MNAGRELDALVAEKVMGEKRPAPTNNEVFARDALIGTIMGNPIPSEDGAWRSITSFDAGDEPEWIPRPYSTDIAAAWEVLERISEQGWCLELADYRNSRKVDEPGWWWELGRWEEIKDEYAPREMTHGLTHYWELDGGASAAPLAICLAALHAVEWMAALSGAEGKENG